MEMEIEQEIFIGDVKREPSVDYEFILPPPADDEAAPKDEPDDEQTLDDGGAPDVDEDVAPKRQQSQKSASSSKVFKCNECSFQTNLKTNLTSHEGTHNKPFECETCQKKFSINSSLKNHQMQHKHGIYATSHETFDCNECGKAFSTSTYLRQHQANVHDIEEVQCNVCEKVFKSRTSLRSHSRTHVKVECSICRKMVVKAAMAHHVRTHTAETFFECDICGSSCRTKGNLKGHIERVHLLPKLVSDSACCKDFGDFELLQKLQRSYEISATTSERKFKCDICSSSFVTPNRLKKHKRYVHVDKTFQCETCKKAFKSKGLLNRHKANAHSKVRCTICKKEVGQRYLKKHMKFHQPGSHFESDLCGFKTKWKKNLAGHMNSKHRSGSKRNCGSKVNAKQASSSSLPGGLSLSDNNPEPVPNPQTSNRPFMLSFVDRIKNLPPHVQHHFQRHMEAFIDELISQNVK